MVNRPAVGVESARRCTSSWSLSGKLSTSFVTAFMECSASCCAGSSRAARTCWLMQCAQNEMKLARKAVNHSSEAMVISGTFWLTEAVPLPAMQMSTP
jgi:hypothetical protein